MPMTELQFTRIRAHIVSLTTLIEDVFGPPNNDGSFDPLCPHCVAHASLEGLVDAFAAAIRGVSLEELDDDEDFDPDAIADKILAGRK